MTRLTTILLTLAITLSNAICVCAIPASSAQQSSAPAPPACHGPKSSKTSDQHQPAPRECAHCTGVVSADTSVAKTIAPPLTLLDTYFVVHNLPAIFAATTTSFASLDHTGLSPPERGRTLLDLACLFTT